MHIYIYTYTYIYIYPSVLKSIWRYIGIYFYIGSQCIATQSEHVTLWTCPSAQQFNLVIAFHIVVASQLLNIQCSIGTPC